MVAVMVAAAVPDRFSIAFSPFVQTKTLNSTTRFPFYPYLNRKQNTGYFVYNYVGTIKKIKEGEREREANSLIFRKGESGTSVAHRAE